MDLLQLFELCMKAKEYGIDAFFDYSPHVNGVEVRVYENGWVEDVHWDKSFNAYTDSGLFKENIEAAREYLAELVSIKKGEI